MAQDKKRIDSSKLGIFRASFDPVETVRMEGNFYRGIANGNLRRTWWMRVMGVLIGFLFLSSATLAFISAYLNGWWGILPGILGLLLLLVGLKLIWASIRR